MKNNKINNVLNLIKNKKIAIAFSGGADSTLLCYLAKKVSNNPIAITFDNHLFNKNLISESKKIAKNIDIEQIILKEDFFKNENIIKNDHNRCYFCRKTMYENIIEIANKNNYNLIADGTNITDLTHDRPGILVNYEHNIFSPFIKSKLESYEIKQYLKENNIYYNNSTTCLATRFNSKITKNKIEKINYIENFILKKSKIDKVKLNLDSHILEVGDITKFEDNTLLNKINDEINKTFEEKINLKIAKIKENDRIILEKNYFQLPYEIEVNQCEKNIAINENGLIKKNNLTKEELLEILPKIKRKKRRD